MGVGECQFSKDVTLNPNLNMISMRDSQSSVGFSHAGLGEFLKPKLEETK
jgi:hypothetical protein